MLKAEGIGRLVADPELRYTTGGKAVCGFRLACDADSGNKADTNFIQVITWEKLALSCGEHLQKGRLVYVEGNLDIREFTRQDKSKGTATEITAGRVKFLDRKKESGDA